MPESKWRGGRPSRFSAALGEKVLGEIQAGVPLRDAAKMAGVGSRTLDRWLARGRAGDPALADWARRVDKRREDLRRARVAAAWRKDREEAPARWQRFKAARERWWMERLGPRRFWLMRLAWLSTHGKTRAFERTLERMRAEGFGANFTL